MKKFWIYLFSFLLMGLLIGGGYILFQKPSVKKTQHIKITYGAYYFPIHVSSFDKLGIPCLSVQIEDQIIPMQLDLGFQGEFALSPVILNTIQNKTYLREDTFCGIRGIEYQRRIYRTPSVELGRIIFRDTRLYEESEDFLKDSVFLSDDETDRLREGEGRIGWRIFKSSNLLLDLGNSLVAFVDSLETLQQNGCEHIQFIKVPLLLDRGFIEIQSEGSEGLLRCMLDTGATWNLMNTTLEDGESLEKTLWEPENILEFFSFKMDQVEFGPIKFHRMPIKIPIHIDAILGMDFFRAHIVFLDFAEGYAYLAKRVSSHAENE